MRIFFIIYLVNEVYNNIYLLLFCLFRRTPCRANYPRRRTTRTMLILVIWVVGGTTVRTTPTTVRWSQVTVLNHHHPT